MCRAIRFFVGQMGYHRHARLTLGGRNRKSILEPYLLYCCHKDMKEFAQFRLDILNQCLWRSTEEGNQERILLTPKAFAVLLYLVERAGQLVGHKELRSAIWSDAHVGPGVLNNQILSIRNALGDRPQNPA